MRTLTPDGIRPAPNRIWRVTFRSAHNRRRVFEVVAKVPYGGVFAMTEQLTRALTVGELLWFRVDPVPAGDINPEMRAALQRWPEALRATSERSEVSWMA
jgi:hypothetical protein